MQTVIVGAGAMGGLFAYLLQRAGAVVHLLERDAAVVDAVSAGGLRVEGISGAHVVPVPIGDECRLPGHPDLIMVFVKAHDTASAAEAIKPLLGPRTVVATLQHGVGNDRILGEALGCERIVAGTTSLGATLLGPGHILHTSWGDSTVAACEVGAQEAAETVAAFLSRHGMKTAVVDDAPSLIWGRVLINAAVGPISALARARNGKLLDAAPAKQLLHAAVDETAAVLTVAGIKLPYRNPRHEVEQTLHRTADNLSAMLQDLYRGRRSEVDFLNGAIIDLAEQVGMDAPINRTLMLLLKATEKETTGES